MPSWIKINKRGVTITMSCCTLKKLVGGGDVNSGLESTLVDFHTFLSVMNVSYISDVECKLTKCDSTPI